MSKCKYAAALAGAGLGDDRNRSEREMVDLLAGKGVPVGRSSIGDHRRGGCACSDAGPAGPGTGEVEVGPDGGEFRNIQSDAPLTDWTHVFERFNLDPDAFIILGDTVRMSSWDQGDKRLYAYRARFAPKPAALIDTEALGEWVQSWDFSDVPALPVASQQTYFVGLADLQLGKGEGDGTPGTLRRAQRSLANVVADIRRLHSMGIYPRTLLLANMGDHMENVYSSYANQAYTVDLNIRDQFKTAMQVNLQWIKTLAPYFEEVIYASCMCNHGQLTRQGGKTNMTDDSDNSTGLLADTLEQMTSLSPGLEHVSYITPRDEMITLVSTNGVNIALSHGHKITGNEAAWLAKQSQNLVHRKKFIVDLWVTAHKHHANAVDMGPYSRIQCTTLDPGSKYFEDMTGQYSTPGVTVFLTGPDMPMRWDYYRVL